MLSHILRCVARYEHTHGFPPNVIYINPGHWHALRAACPGLFRCNGGPRLGFHVLVLPEEALPHPRAARLLLARERAGTRARGGAPLLSPMGRVPARAR